MGTAHHVSNALALSARPIAVSEFVSALSSIWSPFRGASHRNRKKETIGLAISGGVDSMALAALCSQIQPSNITAASKIDIQLASLPEKIIFKAFVVDHGVRNGSADEAQAVAKVLDARGIRLYSIHGSGKLTFLLGIKTEVLKINWGPCEKAAELLNFESLARKHRYQVLGNACRAHGINSLFLAHHEDDQVETVIMRLIAGHKRLGLMGMKPDSAIPECHGIHGVHESGGRPDFLPISKILRRETSKEAKIRANSYMKQKSLVPLETGGIRIYRPLLNFDKARLIATSKDQEIEWFEDHTNKDPTLTSRNAVRHLYRSHALPAALTKPAILKILHRCQEITNAQLKMVDTCLRQCIIKSFDTRSGTLNIRFNDMYICPLGTDRRLIAAHVLRHITMLVTPREHVPLSTLHVTLKNVFPEVFPPEERVSKLASFTVAGLQFHPGSMFKTGKISSSLSKCEWFISREPYNNSVAMPLITVPYTEDAHWSEWALYDGRYWIRIQNLSGGTVLVRPFRPTDYAKFRRSLSQAERNSLPGLLKKIVPGNSRFTIPAVVYRGDDGKETVIGLATLDYRTPECKGVARWEVRYKKLNLGGLLIPNQEPEDEKGL